MNQTSDTANVLIRPPLAWLLALVIGLLLDWLFPAKFVPAAWPAGLIGVLLFVSGIALGVFGVVTFRKAGTEVPTNRPSTTVVANGPYRWTRNPIYVGMLLGQAGFAVGFNSLWLVLTWAIFFLVLRFGVVAREEAYLERKFGAPYLQYKGKVRRWL